MRARARVASDAACSGASYVCGVVEAERGATLVSWTADDNDISASRPVPLPPAASPLFSTHVLPAPHAALVVVGREGDVHCLAPPPAFANISSSAVAAFQSVPSVVTVTCGDDAKVRAAAMANV